MGEKLKDKTVAFVATDGSSSLTSRKPDDPPALCAKVVEQICEGRHDEQALQTADAG